MKVLRSKWGRTTLVGTLVLVTLAVVGGVRPSRAELLADSVTANPNAAVTTPAFFDIFMDIPGIEGESANPLHKGAIEIESWSWGVSQTAAGGGSGAGVVGGEKTGHVSLIKRIDKATPPLFKHCVDGTVLPLVTVQLTRADGLTYLKYELKNVMVNSIAHGGDVDGDGMPDETVELSLRGAKLTYTQLDAAGKPLSQSSAEW